jgi:hypothetical protein
MRAVVALLALLVLPASTLGASSSPRLLAHGALLDGARVGAPLTIQVAGSQVTAVRYVLDGHYLGKSTAPPFAWKLPATPGVHRLKARLEGVPGELEARFTVVDGALPAAPRTPAPGTVVRGADVYVRGSDALTAALARAIPGQTIHLADGDYTGRLRVGDYTGAFAVTRSGTATVPITLVGGRGAVLDGGGTGGHYGLYVSHASWWRFRGFTVADASKGVVSDGGSHDVYDRLEIREIGAEGLHLRAFSRDNLVTGVQVHATGQKQAQFGEGVYVGSANSNWPTYSGGRPDTSDGNRIVASTIWDTGAENIDIKEGTTGGTVQGNRLDGIGMSGENHADSLIDVKGSGWRIVGNHGTVSGASAVLDGFQVHDVYGDWGNGNVFRQNVLVFPHGIAGYGLDLQGSNVVGCGNLVTGASAGRANVRCTAR